MAEEQAGLNFYDFMYPKVLLEDLFDINIQGDKYVERAYNIWRDIGNIAGAIHAFEFVVPQDRKVMLPCNMEFIEAVSRGNRWIDDYGDVYNAFILNNNTSPNQFLADSIVRNTARYDRHDSQRSNLHPNGEYMVYELGGFAGNAYMEFNEKYIGDHGVCIYRGIVMDQDGNPLLNRKEAEAIAYKMAFLDLQKRAYKGDRTVYDLLQMTKEEAGRRMAGAKIPEYVTQNQWDRVLSAMTRHDRKVFWSGYKTMQ